MQLVEYDGKYKKYFVEFNTNWIIDNFGYTEDEDKEVFENIDDMVKNGAMVYFALDGDNVLACCMTHKMNDDTWEICKLASNKNISHKGAGSAVFKACFDYALNHGAKRLFLISNTKLKPALHIYEKLGFKEIKLTDYEYDRGDIAFEYIPN